MNRITTAFAATTMALALMAGAAPAQAVEFPPNWACKNVGGTTYNCKATITVKAGTKHTQWLWAVKTAKNRITNQARARGVPFVEIPVSGCRQKRGPYWTCNLQWTMSLPDEAPAAPQ